MKLVPTRDQGFTIATYRAETRHHMKLGATPDGKLTSLSHEGWEVTSRPSSYNVAGVESSAEIAAALVNRKNLPQPRAGSVAIIPIYGVIAPRMNMFSEYSGGTTFQQLTSLLQQAERNADGGNAGQGLYRRLGRRNPG